MQRQETEKGRIATTSFSMPYALLWDIQDEAKRQDVRASQLVRKVMREYLDLQQLQRQRAAS